MMQDVFGFDVDMLSPQSFDFVLRYGRPFLVMPRPACGLVCFGVDSPQYGRLLIRFAGAALTGGPAPGAAVGMLQGAMPAYEALYPHPALIKLQGHGAAGGGYAAIFRWVEGESLGEAAAMRRLLYQPLLVRLRMIDRVFDFHAWAAAKGYAAVGFGVSCLRADFATGGIAVSDIDLYRPMPAKNDRGRMPGSHLFLSPEDYELGAPLDEVSMQYTMGALAFAFFAGPGIRERGAWMAGEPLYRVAERACSEARGERYATLGDFLRAWRRAAGETVG